MEKKWSGCPLIRGGLVLFISMLLLSLTPMITGFTLQADPFLGDKHQAKGVKCDSCHKEDPPREEDRPEVCMTCHGDLEKLVGKTNRVVPNPHASPHVDPGTPLVCNQCHHIHKPSNPSCLHCHPDYKFRNI